MLWAAVVGFGVLGALVPTVAFVAARAKLIDVALAAVGYGGFVATIASVGLYYRAGAYLYIPLAALFTAAWVAATVRVLHYRPPQWRWQRKRETSK